MTIDRHVTRGVGLKVSFQWDFSSTLQQQGAFTLSTDSVWHSTKIFDIFHIFAKEADLARSCSAVSPVHLHQKQYASFWGNVFGHWLLHEKNFGQDDGSKCCCFLLHSWLRCTFRSGAQIYRGETCCSRIFGVYSPTSVQISPVSTHLTFLLLMYLTYVDSWHLVLPCMLNTHITTGKMHHILKL